MTEPIAQQLQAPQTGCAQHTLGGRMRRWLAWPNGAISLALLLHALAFVVTWPDVPINTDESMYVSHAMTIASGERMAKRIDFKTFAPVDQIPSFYPLGTILAQVPFVWLFGWRGAYAVSMLGFLLAVHYMRRLLQSLGAEPMFAVLLLAYPACAVLSRVATSDSITLGLVALTLYLFATGEKGAPWRWWAAGWIAALAFCCREATALVTAPFIIGALLRRNPGAYRLALGGLLGGVLRGAIAAVAYGNPFYRHPGYGTFSIAYLLANAWFYLILTLVLLPGGLWFLLRYRGWRWPEVIISAITFTLLHAAYFYGVSESGGRNTIVVGGRYLLPAVPVYVLAIAAGASSLKLRPTLPASILRVARFFERKWRPAFAAVALSTVAVHPALAIWSRSHYEISAAICREAPPNARLITNGSVTGKWLEEWNCNRAFTEFGAFSPQKLVALSADGRPLFVALVERGDSAAWQERSRQMTAQLQKNFGTLQLELVLEMPPSWQQLRIWRVKMPPAMGKGN